MYMIASMSITLLLISSLTKMWNKFINIKNFMNSLESGFNNSNNFKINLSMNFTFILMIFILFDIELMMFIPLMINSKMNNNNMIPTIMFIMFIILTTLIEIKNNKIKWII